MTGPSDAQLQAALAARLPATAGAGLRERILDAAAATRQQRPLPMPRGRISLGHHGRRI